MTDATETNSFTAALTVPKFTATQIETDCPAQLQDLAKEITEGLKKVYEQKKLADDQVIAVKKLIAEVKALCDVGGFAAFREKFFPNLGKSRVYELLAIATGKTTLVEHRAKERKRKQKTRANQNAPVANSGTVPENAVPKIEAPGAELREPARTTITPDQSVGPAKPPSSVSPGDEALQAFSSVVCRLAQITRNKKPVRYTKTSVSVGELARLGTFLTDIANLKVSGADVPVLPGNGTAAAPEQSPESMKVEHPARDAEELRHD